MGMKTIKEVAEELEISVQAIYKKINKSMKNELSEHLKQTDGQLFIDDNGFKLIKKSMEPSILNQTNTNLNQLNSDLSQFTTDISVFLKEQIILKDKIIEAKEKLINEKDLYIKEKDNKIYELTDTITDLTERLAVLFENSQQLQKNQQLLEAKTIIADETESGEPEKKKWFFGKKRNKKEK